VSDDRTQVVANLFDRMADTYDGVGVEFFKPIAQGLVDELAPRAGERALDVGCGRGAALFPLAQTVGQEGRAVGIDLSSQMVEATAADATALGLSVEVRVGDAMDPEFDAESFELLASSLVLFFLPDPAAALRRWRSLLVAGGRVGVSTFGSYSPDWRVDTVFKPYLSKDAPDPGMYGAASPFGSDAGVEGLLMGAGYTQVRTATMTVPVRFDDEDHWYRWTWSTGRLRWWEAVPPGDRDKVRTAAYQALDRCRDTEGRIGFDQVARFTLGVR
jgi:ubiquinone/menaquinone biosynthesis C-methylase UbiE